MNSTALLERTGQVGEGQRRLRGENPANPQPAWLYDAVRATVHRERGTAKVIACDLACKESHVTDLADPLRRVPLKAFEIPDITRASGSFAILDALEAQVGRVAFHLPSVNPHVDQMNRELARTLKQFGEFIETNGDVLEDGRIEPHELQLLLGTIDAMVADLSEYRALAIEKARLDARETVTR